MKVTRMTVRERSMTHCCYSPARLSMQIDALQGNSYPLPSVQLLEQSGRKASGQIWSRRFQIPQSQNNCVIAEEISTTSPRVGVTPDKW